MQSNKLPRYLLKDANDLFQSFVVNSTKMLHPLMDKCNCKSYTQFIFHVLFAYGPSSVWKGLSKIQRDHLQTTLASLYEGLGIKMLFEETKMYFNHHFARLSSKDNEDVRRFVEHFRSPAFLEVFWKCLSMFFKSIMQDALDFRSLVCCEKRERVMSPILFYWTFPWETSWRIVSGVPLPDVHRRDFPGVCFVTWIACVGYFLFIRPFFIVFSGSFMDSLFFLWFGIVGIISIFCAFLFFIMSFFMPFFAFFENTWIIWEAYGSGEIVKSGFVPIWIRIIGGVVNILSGVRIIYLLPSFMKCLYFSANHIPYWKENHPIPEKFADHIISVYENTPIRNDLLERAFGEDIASIIREFLPEFQVFDEFSRA